MTEPWDQDTPQVRPETAAGRCKCSHTERFHAGDYVPRSKAEEKKPYPREKLVYTHCLIKGCPCREFRPVNDHT